MSRLGLALRVGALSWGGLLLLEAGDLVRGVLRQPGGAEVLSGALLGRVLAGMAAFALPVILVEACCDALAGRLPWPRRAVPARTLGLAGGLLCGLLPLAWLGHRLAAIPFFIAEEHGPMLAGALLLGVAAMAAPPILARFAPSGGVSPRDLRALLLGAAAAALLARGVLAGSGTLVRVPVGRSGVHLAFFLAAWGMALVTMAGLTLRALRRAAAAPRGRAPGGLVALLAAGALVLADQRLFPGLYPSIHWWLKAHAYLAMDLGVVLLAPAAARAWGGRKLAFAAGACVLLGAAGAAGLPALSPTARAALAGGAWGRPVLEIFGGAADEIEVPAFDAALEAAVRPERHARAVRSGGTPPPILLLTVDTVRADAVGAFGGPAGATPHIDALAARSVRFERAYAQGSRTSEAMTALMTGRYGLHVPGRRLIYVEGGALRTLEQGPPEGLAYSFTTVPAKEASPFLAERLKAAGYRTAAVPFAGRDEFFRPDLGFSRGFDAYEDLAGSGREAPASAWVADQAILHLANLAAGGSAAGPFFLWVHMYAPHESRGDRERYATLVAAVDEAIGRILEATQNLGIADRAVIAFASDHGEAFGEHRTTSHGSSLHDEQIRVPFLLHVPGIPPRSDHHPVAAFDLAATLCALAGVEPTNMDAVNLLPLLENAAAAGYPADRPIFTELLRFLGPTGNPSHDRKALIAGRYKLIHDRIVGTWRLYDLQSDPLEQTNQALAHPLAFRRLSHLLRYWERGGGDARNKLR